MCDDDGQTTRQRPRRGQRLAHREAVGKLGKKGKPWRGDTPGFLSCDTVLSTEFAEVQSKIVDTQ